MTFPFHLTGTPRAGGFEPPVCLGVEQEFELFDAQRQLDFRGLFAKTIAATRSVSFRNCDSAVILDAGYMLACDGWEAEFATLPVAVDGDGALALAREATRCRAHMRGLLERAGVRRLRGYSTHLNIGVPAGREWELAEALAGRVGPALVLLMESRLSPGLLIRPRRGRIEIGSEYIDDERQLAAAALFLAGTLRAYLQYPQLWQRFPRLRLEKWEPADIRPGIFLPPDAYGASLPELGRSAQLQLVDGSRMTAGELLEICAGLALQALDGCIDARAADALRAVLRKPGSLQIEREDDPARVRRRLPRRPAAGTQTLQALAQAGSRLGLRPAFVDWEGVAFSWEKGSTSVVLGLPWESLPQLFSAARSRMLAQFVAALGPPAPVLSSLDQFQSPGIYQQADPAALGAQALNNGKGSLGKGGPKNGAPKPGTPKPQPPAAPLPFVEQQAPAARPGWWLPLGLVLLGVTLLAICVLSTGTAIWLRTSRRLPQVPTLPSEQLTPRSAPPGPTVTATLPARRVMPPASLTSTDTATPSPTLGAPTFTLTGNAFCRAGPGSVYRVVTGLTPATTVNIRGRSADGRWYYVFWDRYNVLCWVGVAGGTPAGNLPGIPVLTAAPTPIPTLTSTPSRTPRPGSKPTLPAGGKP